MSNRLNQEREAELQPKRLEYAFNELQKLGFQPINIDDKQLQFFYKDEVITFWPYSGWHSGKTIKDGRGIQNLLEQLKP